jgi:heat shock protein HtpX
MEIKGLDPIKDQRLFRIVEKVMDLYNFKKIRVTVRPKMENAIAIPFFGIIIGQPLIDILSDEELEGIIAHEFSHIFNHDHLSSSITYLIFISPFILWYIFLYNSGNISTLAAILFLVAIVIWLYGIRIRNWMILQDEIMADREAVIKTKNPEALRSALIYLISAPLTSKDRPRVFSVTLNTIYLLASYFFGISHPLLKERIEYLDFAERILKT